MAEPIRKHDPPPGFPPRADCVAHLNLTTPLPERITGSGPFSRSYSGGFRLRAVELTRPVTVAFPDLLCARCPIRVPSQCT